MKSRMPVPLLIATMAWAGALWAQQAKKVGSKDPVPSATVAAKNPAPTAPVAGKSSASPKTAKALAQQVEPRPEVEGDAAYKANCARCHLAPRKFSERQMVTIMMHMRARANLTEKETNAILKYLTR